MYNFVGNMVKKKSTLDFSSKNDLKVRNVTKIYISVKWKYDFVLFLKIKF